MGSAWGYSWGTSWGYSWGAIDQVISNATVLNDGGGNGGVRTSKRKRGHGWERERAIFDESLKRFDDEHMRRIARTMADSERPRANRIARKLADYNGDIEDLYRIQRDLSRLEAELAKRLNDTKSQIDHESELRAASQELTAILLDEEDAISAILSINELEYKLLFSMISNKIY